MTLFSIDLVNNYFKADIKSGKIFFTWENSLIEKRFPIARCLIVTDS